MSGRIDLANGWLSPIHTSSGNGLHIDYNPYEGGKLHIPYEGQTTLDMFSKPSYENTLSALNSVSTYGLGTFRADKAK